MFKILLLIGTGSFFGGISRFLLSKYVQNLVLSSFPFGTMAVNILGSFLIGVIYGVSQRSNMLDESLKLLLAVGFCGGFTTFSTFSQENMALLKDGDIMYFFAYSTISVLLGVAAVIFGAWIIKVL